MNIIKVPLTASYAKIAIIISRFNEFTNKNILESAIDVLKRIGEIQDKNITVIWVPGACELPITCKIIAKNKKYHAIITLGTIIKGETLHFKSISSIVNKEIANISITHNIPIIIGVITANNIEQAINRSGMKFGNKGCEAALTTLEMINIIKKINSQK
ncbi:6,7-dimethyl-8-ribityllumazine synthase [Candidatus Purcelliella pentastirinorum]|uniref:6,7-dimethyl-8-ribityllumazine synthase n=1 Tax=Candidatus Purcelliella pentastirinorum TaxID=472834 RepID=A0AAX3N7A9_9ENTR|nr:6,7-dimethyl-8-ribityllumazine synthase [Candidatus Purcelliella pentastirinorum]WDI78333.1 6,7-dimethyl-8-ribityllumazine synthase [Candidatus Purcelliella pentastirinorum]WDR80641.1 6,7-dimethyl-8-ribityllumazine synthase [Candidatus Purcelliella pentastirinorum]